MKWQRKKVFQSGEVLYFGRVAMLSPNRFWVEEVEMVGWRVWWLTHQKSIFAFLLADVVCLVRVVWCVVVWCCE